MKRLAMIVTYVSLLSLSLVALTTLAVKGDGVLKQLLGLGGSVAVVVMGGGVLQSLMRESK